MGEAADGERGHGASEISAPRGRGVAATGSSVLWQCKSLPAFAAACDPSHLHAAHPLPVPAVPTPTLDIDFDGASVFEIERRLGGLAPKSGMRARGRQEDNLSAKDAECTLNAIIGWGDMRYALPTIILVGCSRVPEGQ
jgi:hypothetical protein